MQLTPRIRRIRPQFSLRTWLVLSTVVGAWLGWQAHQARQQRLAVQAIQETGGWVYYDYQDVPAKPAASGVVGASSASGFLGSQQPRGPRWLRRILGDDYFRDVACVVFYDDNDNSHARELARRCPKARLMFVEDEAYRETIERCAVRLTNKSVGYPALAAVYLERAKAYHAHGQSRKALADYEEALKLNPKKPQVFNDLAWLQATARDPVCRDGAEAVTNATIACEANNFRDYATLDTLAAAYAEQGDFASAIRWQQEALTLAPQSLLKAFQGRLSLYRSGKPHRD